MAASNKIEGIVSVLCWPMPDEKKRARIASKHRTVAALYDGPACGVVQISCTEGGRPAGSSVAVARSLSSAHKLLAGADDTGINHVLQMQTDTGSPNMILEQTAGNPTDRLFARPRHPEDSEHDLPEYTEVSFFKITPETEYIFIKEHGRLLDYSRVAGDCLYPVWAAVPVGEPIDIPEKYRFLGASYSGNTPERTAGQMVFRGESGTWYICQVCDAENAPTSRAWFTSSPCIEYTGNFDVSQYIISAYAGVLTDSSKAYGPQPTRELPPECSGPCAPRQMFDAEGKPYGLNLLRGDSQCPCLSPAKIRIPPYAGSVMAALHASPYTCSGTGGEPCGALLPRGPQSQSHGVGVLQEGFVRPRGTGSYLLASVPSDFVPIIYDSSTTGSPQGDYCGAGHTLWERVPSEVFAVCAVILRHMVRAGFKKIMLGKILYEGLSSLAVETGIDIQQAQVISVPGSDDYYLIKDHPGLTEMTERLSFKRSLRWTDKNVSAQEADDALTSWEEHNGKDCDLVKPVQGIVLSPRQGTKLYVLTALKEYINHRWGHLNIRLGIY